MGVRSTGSDGEMGPLGCGLRLLAVLALGVVVGAAFDGDLGFLAVPVMVLIATWLLWDPVRRLVRLLRRVIADRR